MTKKPLRATGLVAAGVVAGGLLAGTLSAQAADTSDGQPPADGPQNVRMHRGGPGGPGGPMGLGGPGGGAELAKQLGVTQAKLRAAMKEVRDDLRSAKGERPDGPPSAADREANQDKFVTALAKELGVSEAKVKAAFEKVEADHAADRRDKLSTRLDDAVKAGKLTADDKAAVLKAFDAGVLGGPGPR